MKYKKWFIFLCALALVSAPAQVFAHAILVVSHPSKGDTVKAPECNVDLRFNSRVDADRSVITVADTHGHTSTVSPLKQVGPNGIMGNAGNLVPGSWVLHWQVLAIDGHVTRGSVEFNVK